MSKSEGAVAFEIITMDSPKVNIKVDDVYEFDQIIGEGAFSSVVLAIHNETKKRVAIKILSKENIDTDKRKDRIRNEISLLKLCKHKNIIKYVEHYESEIDVSIVFELCVGGELFERIAERGPFSEPNARLIFKQILSAIQCLHVMGIVHRDIKPENIFFINKEDSDIKIGDFGLAKILTGKNVVEDVPNSPGRNLLKASMSGTPAYCAPERLQNDSESKAVDMWSVGCILYFMLYGRPPFYSQNEDEDEAQDEIMDAVTECKVVYDSETKISDQAKDLISRLLNPDPIKRATADNALNHSWMKSTDQVETKNPKKEFINRDYLKKSINSVIDARSDPDKFY